jgi:hypothetical protein
MNNIALEGAGETYLRFFGQYLEGFPVRIISFSDPAEKAQHDKMVSLVERMLALHKQNPRTPQEQDMVKQTRDREEEINGQGD